MNRWMVIVGEEPDSIEYFATEQLALAYAARKLKEAEDEAEERMPDWAYDIDVAMIVHHSQESYPDGLAIQRLPLVEVAK